MAPSAGFRAWLETIAAVALIGAAAAVMWSELRPRGLQPPPPDLNGRFVSFANAPTLGPTTAERGLIVFSDFECPFCARFATGAFQQVVVNFVNLGQLVVAFKHLPLTDIHPLSMFTAAATDCARGLNKFWPLHDLLFAREQRLSRELIYDYGTRLGLDSEWRACANRSDNSTVSADMREAQSLGITSTPLVVIGLVDSSRTGITVQKTISGAAPPTEFLKAINAVTR